MASQQAFFSVMRNFSCRLTAGVTADDGSSQTGVTWFGATTGGAAGTVPGTDWMLSGLTISDSSATGVANIADSILRVFVGDPATGGLTRLFAVVDLGDPLASDTVSKGISVYVPFGPSYTFGAFTTISFNLSVTPVAGNLDILGFVMVS